jgi:hypothetical protein
MKVSRICNICDLQVIHHMHLENFEVTDRGIICPSCRYRTCSLLVPYFSCPLCVDIVRFSTCIRFAQNHVKQPSMSMQSHVQKRQI